MLTFERSRSKFKGQNHHGENLVIVVAQLWFKMVVNALQTLGRSSPILLPFFSFPLPLSHFLPSLIPSPLIQLESLGSAASSRSGSGWSPATKRIFGAFRGKIKRFRRHIGSRALSFSDPYIHFACLSVLLSVRNFGAKYLGNEAR